MAFCRLNNWPHSKLPSHPLIPFATFFQGKIPIHLVGRRTLEEAFLLRNFSTFYFRTKRLEIIFGTFHSREFHLCLISAQQFSSLSPQELLILFIALPGMVNQPRKERTLILKWKYVQHYFKTGFRTTHLTPNSDTTTICLRVCKSKTSDLSYF